MLLNVETFFGRFHPLVVHLPIGFLLLGIVFYLLSLRKKQEGLYAAVPISLFFGSLSAAFACITGYVLSLSGNHEPGLLSDHMWLGIITTIFSFLAWFISLKKISLSFFSNAKILLVALFLIFIFITITGHLGGTLTHGADYFSTDVLLDKEKVRKKINNLNDAYVFADLVKPILEEKCGGCHNDSKKKGRLSIENYQSIVKGGKHGPAIQPGDLINSEIIKRISLPSKSKKFMPAGGRTPLTWQETEVLRWWIEKAADSKDKKLVATDPPAAIFNYAVAFFGAEPQDASTQYAPVSIKANPVSKEVIENLKQSGFRVKNLNYNPDLLDVTLQAPGPGKNVSILLESLSKIKDNILWLNVSNSNVSDNDLQMINQFTNLQRLRLDGNPVSDKGLQKLGLLSHLQSLNLHQTRVTKDGISLLSKITSLKRVYIWNSGIRKEDFSDAKFSFTIISGFEDENKAVITIPSSGSK